MKYTKKNPHPIFNFSGYLEDKAEYEENDAPSYSTWVSRRITQTTQNERMDIILADNPHISSDELRVLMK